MQKRGTDPKLVRAATAEQLVTLSSVVALELVKGLSKVPFAQVQGWLSNKSFPQKAARKLAQELKAEVSQHDPRLVREQQFLASLGITVDITGLTISELPRGFNQIAINPVGQLTKEKLFEFCSKSFCRGNITTTWIKRQPKSKRARKLRMFSVIAETPSRTRNTSAKAMM